VVVTTAADKKRLLRRYILAYAIVFAAIAAGLVAFVISSLRNPPGNTCEALLGPLPELEGTVGVPLHIESAIGGDRDCDLTVGARDVTKFGAPVVVIANKHAHRLAELRKELDGTTFSARETLSLPTGVGWLYVAGATPPPLDHIQLGSGGDPLAHVPPAHHVGLFAHKDTITILRMERRAFTPEQARQLIAIVAGRVPRK
jgi:hypothetical protein